MKCGNLDFVQSIFCQREGRTGTITPVGDLLDAMWSLASYIHLKILEKARHGGTSLNLSSQEAQAGGPL